MTYRSLTVYAIKQKSTGYFLPPAKNRTGGSWVEPTKDATPKLFKHIGHANGFLTVWLKGGIKVTHHQDYFGEYHTDLDTIPKPHRDREDMEVVALALVEVPIPVKI